MPHLSLPLLHAGKVRELYSLGDDRLLLLATDNVSAYDRVLPTPIPDKGALLTQLSVWWAGQLADVVPTHLVSDSEVPAEATGRAVVVEKLEMIGVECVARGYLAGSAWEEYQRTGTVAGLQLPEGLTYGSRLDRPIFTPARKAPMGSHDENITYAQLVDEVGEDTAKALRSLTLRLYIRAERIARSRGLILVDTKFEFGRRADGTIVLADEVLTPDSSRYWDAASYAPGTDMAAGDKQYLRDWLRSDSGWHPDSGEPAPDLPEDVVGQVRAKYADTFRRLTDTEVTPAAPLIEVPADDQAAAEQSDGDAVPADHPHAHALTATQDAGIDHSTGGPTVTFVVEVMPKPEILDPQGKAVTGALRRLGFEGMNVRQGKRFEIVVDGELTQERVDQVRHAAETLLANTVIEDYEVSIVDDGCDCASCVDCTCEDCTCENCDCPDCDHPTEA